MKLLIVFSGDEIFGSIAKRLAHSICAAHDVDIAHEVVCHSAYKVIKQRVSRSGAIKGCSQFLFKVVDFYFLRRKVRKLARRTMGDISAFKIPSLNSFVARNFIKKNKYDVVIGIATSIVKEEALSTPRYGFLNIHPGILPMYRGAGNFWAVINDDFENIGCTVHWMTPVIDEGKVLLIKKIDEHFDDIWDMNYRAMCVGADALAVHINNGSLFETEVSLDGSRSNYFTWNDISEYLIFRKKLSMRNS